MHIFRFLVINVLEQNSDIKTATEDRHEILLDIFLRRFAGRDRNQKLYKLLTAVYRYFYRCLLVFFKVSGTNMFINKVLWFFDFFIEWQVGFRRSAIIFYRYFHRYFQDIYVCSSDNSDSSHTFDKSDFDGSDSCRTFGDKQ